MTRQEIRRATWNPIAYHLLTLGSVLLFTAVVTLAFAGLGLLAADVFTAPADPGTVPGRGVWITPLPAPGPTP